MKLFKRESVRLYAVLVLALLLNVALQMGLQAQMARAADPTPQGVTAWIGQPLFSYFGVTSTAAGNTSGLAVTTAAYGLADCYNKVAYQGGLVNTATVKIQSSADGTNWVDTQAFTDITNTTELSRVVLYGQFTRAIVSSIFTTANPITGSVNCTLKNFQ